jgi:hypothetical protein
LVSVVENLVAVAVKGLERIQSGTMGGEEQAPMNIVGSALGSNLNLSSAETAVLGVIAVGDYLDVFDGLLGWRDDGRSTPDGADRTDPIDGDAVVLILLTRG